jgi:hypothetical protein
MSIQRYNPLQHAGQTPISPIVGITGDTVQEALEELQDQVLDLSGGTDTFITGTTFNGAVNRLDLFRNDNVTLSTFFTTFSGLTITNNIDVQGSIINSTGVLSFDDDVNVTGNILVDGNVTILGSATTINSQTLLIEDNIITLNSNVTGSTEPILDAGIETLRGSATTATILWNETLDRWEVGLSGSTSEIITANNFPDFDVFVSGGTFDGGTDTLTLNRSNGSDIVISGFADNFTTGATLIGNTVFFDRNDSLSAYTVDLSSFIDDTNTFVTGGTVSGTSLTLGISDGSTVVIDVTELTVASATSINSIVGITGNTVQDALEELQTQLNSVDTDTNTFVTGFTYTPNSLTISQNDGSTFAATINEFSGLTINGDLIVTGDTTLNSVTATTIDSSTILSGGTDLIQIINDLDTFVSGGTVTGSTITLDLSDGTDVSIDASSLVTVDTFVTGFTRTGSVVTLFQNEGQSDLSITLDASGVTVNPTGTLTSTDVQSALEELQSEIDGIVSSSGDTFVTGGTVTGSDLVLELNDASTVTIDTSDYFDNINVTGGTVSATTLTLDLSDNTSVNIDVSGLIEDTDNFVTGGTLDFTGGTIDFVGTSVATTFPVDVSDLIDLDRVRTLYVGKHGSDSNDGKTPRDAFLTIGAAITAASALTPVFGDEVAIIIEDPGVYTETDLVLPSYVSLVATSATLSVTGSTGMTISDESFVQLKYLLTSGDATGIINTGNPAYIDLERITHGGTGVAVGNFGDGSSAGTFLKFDFAVGTSTGILFRQYGSPSSYAFEGGAILLTDNGIVVQSDSVGSMFGSFDSVSSSASATGATAFQITSSGDRIDINTRVINWAGGEIYDLSGGTLSFTYSSTLFGTLGTVTSGTVNRNSTAEGVHFPQLTETTTVDLSSDYFKIYDDTDGVHKKIKPSNLPFLTGSTDTFVTGFTLSNSLLSILQNEGQSGLTVTLTADNVNITTITGLTATTVQDALSELSLELTETASNSVYAQMAIIDNTVETIISASNIPTKASGTTLADGLIGFSHTDNRLTYTATTEVNRLVLATIYIKSVANNKDIEGYLAKNGSVITTSKSPGRIQTSGQVEVFVPQALITLNTNDYIEVFISNISDSTNLIWEDGVITIS